MISNITPTIKYIGVDDLDIDLFESQYVVPNGVSYNSYLIEDEKIAIMDTADARKERNGGQTSKRRSMEENPHISWFTTWSLTTLLS